MKKLYEKSNEKLHKKIARKSYTKKVHEKGARKSCIKNLHGKVAWKSCMKKLHEMMHEAMWTYMKQCISKHIGRSINPPRQLTRTNWHWLTHRIVSPEWLREEVIFAIKKVRESEFTIDVDNKNRVKKFDNKKWRVK